MPACMATRCALTSTTASAAGRSRSASTSRRVRPTRSRRRSSTFEVRTNREAPNSEGVRTGGPFTVGPLAPGECALVTDATGRVLNIPVLRPFGDPTIVGVRGDGHRPAGGHPGAGQHAVTCADARRVLHQRPVAAGWPWRLPGGLQQRSGIQPDRSALHPAHDGRGSDAGARALEPRPEHQHDPLHQHGRRRLGPRSEGSYPSTDGGEAATDEGPARAPRLVRHT